jgi:hypothetical protein
MECKHKKFVLTNENSKSKPIGRPMEISETFQEVLEKLWTALEEERRNSISINELGLDKLYTVDMNIANEIYVRLENRA